MFLLVWWWRPGGGEGDSQVVDDSINDLVVGDKGDYLHLAATPWTDKRVDLVNLLNPPTQTANLPIVGCSRRYFGGCHLEGETQTDYPP